MNDVPRIISAIEGDDPLAAARLLPLVYEELRKLASSRLAQERPDHMLQATALVHEAYLRLVGPDQAQRWDNAGHFFAAASLAMRRILVENARRKKRARHGGHLQQVEYDLTRIQVRMAPDELIALDDALEELARLDPRKARLVTLRYFGGMTIEQAAEVLHISRATAHRDWTYARAWLYRQINGGDKPG